MNAICECGHELQYHYGYGTKSCCRKAGCECKDFVTSATPLEKEEWK